MECCPVRSIRYPVNRKRLNLLTYLHQNLQLSVMGADEVLPEQPLGFVQAPFGQHDGFRTADRIVDEAFLMQAIHGFPVEAFPGTVLIAW
jgi:hypothetical protein